MGVLSMSSTLRLATSDTRRPDRTPEYEAELKAFIKSIDEAGDEPNLQGLGGMDFECSPRPWG